MASGATISPRARVAGLQIAAAGAVRPAATDRGSVSVPVLVDPMSGARIPGARAGSGSPTAPRPTAVAPARGIAVMIAAHQILLALLAARAVRLVPGMSARARAVTVRTAVPRAAVPPVVPTVRATMVIARMAAPVRVALPGAPTVPGPRVIARPIVLTMTGRPAVPTDPATIPTARTPAPLRGARLAVPLVRVPKVRIARPLAVTISDPGPAAMSAAPGERLTSTAAAARIARGSSVRTGMTVHGGTAPVEMIGRPTGIARVVMIGRPTVIARVSREIVRGPTDRRARVDRRVRIVPTAGIAPVVTIGPRAEIAHAATTAPRGEIAPVEMPTRHEMIAAGATPDPSAAAVPANGPTRSDRTERSAMSVPPGARGRPHGPIGLSSLIFRPRSPGASSTRRFVRSFAA